MKRETWPIERVTPYDNNPRKNDDAVDAVADSIKTYGWRAPILVDKDGVIIAGETRLKSAVLTMIMIRKFLLMMLRTCLFFDKRQTFNIGRAC